MSKRPGGFNALLAKKAKTDQRTAADGSHGHNPNRNRYLATPVQPQNALSKFLMQARAAARRFLPKETKYPVTTPFCEVEARLGVLKLPFGAADRRVTSSGPKQHNGHVVETFHVHQQPNPVMESGLSRTHFQTWTQGGLSEMGPIPLAFGVDDPHKIKQELHEHEYVETVYTGYSNDQRICYDGMHPPPAGAPQKHGKAEYKDKLANMDLTIPAASYDMRISLAAEKVLDNRVPPTPPPGWTSKRIKRRRSYTRRGGAFAWQIDVTEVTTSYNSNRHPEISYEIEMELVAPDMLKLVNEPDEARAQKRASSYAQQAWWILQNINPLADVIDAEETLQDHPNRRAVQVALAQVGYLRKYMHDGGNPAKYNSPIGKDHEPPRHFQKFTGCMPVNFSRHNIEEVQRSPSNGYFLSEKTDGVRHFMVFTGDTVVLVDRAMKGKQPIPVGDGRGDPMGHLVPLIKPGTIFDGEVVMHRGYETGNGKSKPRAVFIVFDVLANSTTEPVLQLPFEQRFHHLKNASFRTPNCPTNMFDDKFVFNPAIALPLVRKNFVKRTALDDLLQHVKEEKGVRTYRNGKLHNHMTDGIIFQPNLPYVCGTDMNLLKWKYLDTVTIDVEIMPPRHNDADDVLRVACLGDEGSMVDMTRHVKLPHSELRRLEADRHESGGRIAEIGFHPETGEWYYLTMRPDKIAPNHISTVLGTVLELAESLGTDELRFRMSVPSGQRDTYRKDIRKMTKQLLDFQRKAAKGGR
ncbi:capping enzyme subunit alpha [Seminavis robusta]|uniref:mRNA 5'-phosphatase n=1 Tax=Seminavis robusta TaxID=568900 RepID=A0A9N8E0U6_9STRA|nr:capping enzyme subunit alpha [Seminavis robusta]|eukprot:Sro536_g162150.1 capping enzyme subunit alpha (749) ;mRNA; f:25832-28267